MLPHLVNISFLRRLLDITINSYIIEERLLEHIHKIFGEDIALSFFLGTPSVHKKITIQISRGDNILGYCKVTDSPKIIELFNKEIALLNKFENQSVKFVPKCLGYFYYNDLTAFFQSTTKTGKSYMVNNLQDLHFQFLEKLFMKTQLRIEYCDTEFAGMLKLLESYLIELELEEQRKIITESIYKVRQKYENKDVLFGVYHGDFTPWNMYMEKADLFVFDFEYGKSTYPKYLDIFHFFTQVKIHIQNKDADKIYKEYMKKKEFLNRYIDNTDIAYIEYLLEIICLYLDRDNGKLSINEKKNMDVWITLLSKLNLLCRDK
jgi:hypothetical protein